MAIPPASQITRVITQSASKAITNGTSTKIASLRSNSGVIEVEQVFTQGQ